jgi:ubiquinone/menaquinone biosynthesis C-methylase UbiE/uncharacterized protein YbaR (Trm112 family)
MNVGTVKYLSCPLCGGPELSLHAFSEADGQVDEGVLRCQSCRAWFRIEDGIADLLPMALRDHEQHASFGARHDLDYTLPGKASSVEGKTSQIEHFHENADEYEKTVVDSNYYKALDQITFLKWADQRLRHGDVVLDLGCGTGRQSIPFAERGIRSIGIDISGEMLKLAKKKIADRGLAPYADFINADAENPPVRDASFQACICYGMLHHLPNQGDTIANAAKKIVPHGFFYSLDPHKSPVRFIFDFFMRVWKLYDEEASDDPLLTEERLMEWMSRAGLKGQTRLTTYLPPHLHHVLEVETNVKLLKASDALFNRISRVRKFAGVVVAEGVKS